MHLRELVFRCDDDYALHFVNCEDWVVRVIGNGDADYGCVICPKAARPTIGNPTADITPWAEKLVALVRENYNLSDSEANDLTNDLSELLPFIA